MGSMGFLLADWSIELIRSRNRKRKNKKNKKTNLNHTEDVTPCQDCVTLSCQLADNKEIIAALREERKDVTKILDVEDSEVEQDILSHVEKVVKEAQAMKDEVTMLKAERLKMAESIGRQLTDRDNTHAEKVKELEAVRLEKEKQLLQSSNQLRQDLATTEKQMKQLQDQLERNNTGKEGDEIDSLRTGLDLKRREVDKLKAEKNSMMLEMERLAKIEWELKLQKKKIEDMTAVIRLKNDQLGQVLDKYDSLQQELEIEVSAHLSCQQELERILVERELIAREHEKRWMDVTSSNEKGMILDVVNKEKGLAYRYNL